VKNKDRAALIKQIEIAKKGVSECRGIELSVGSDMTDTRRWQEHLDRLESSLVDYDERIKK